MLNPKTNQRELVYAVRVTDVTPIEGADKVELAHVNGWHVMVRKDIYKVGDLAIYFEIDSKVPATEPFEFLSKYKYHVKTQRFLRGQVLSQGLIMTPEELCLKDVNEGDFLTEKLGVTYYEPEDNVRKADNKKLAEMKVDKFMIKWTKKHKLLSKIKFIYNLRKKLWLKHYFKNQRKKKTDWPSWVVKTDEERCLGASTKVDTDQGLLRIADIVMKKLPVKVKSYNEKEDKIEYKPITDYQHYNKEFGYFEIKVPFSIGSTKRNKTIKCTPDHKFYVGNGIYKKASELSTDDIIYTSAYTYKEDEFLEFVYGNILGDGHLYREGDLVRFNFNQGESHKDYLDTLYKAYNGSHYVSMQSGFHKEKTNYRFWIVNTDLLSNVVNKCGIFNGKYWSLNNKFCNLLTWKSLATWYMDDGSINNGSTSPVAYLHTEGYCHNEQLLILKTLKDRFGLNAGLNKNKKYECIRIDCNSSKRFFENVAPYIVPCMQYKLPEYLRKNQNYLGNTCYTFDYRLLPTKIKEIKYVNKYMESYDIEVKDNHNFFAGGILTHNCQNLPKLFINNDKLYIATEKIDGTSTTFTMQQAHKKNRKSYVCSRNVVFNTPEKNDRCFYKDTDGNVYLEMFEKYDINKVLNFILDKHPDYEFITIQGETYGGTIQKRNYGPEHRLAIFNYIYKVNGKAPVRLNPIQMKDEINSINEAIGVNLEIVPILDTEFKLPNTCEELLELAEGNSEIDGKPREGIVFRDNKGEESFKAVSNRFLEMFHQ